MECKIRPILEEEYGILEDFLYEAIFVGYKQASLSVQKANYAVRMYQKTGFEIVDENEEEYIMLCRL